MGRNVVHFISSTTLCLVLCNKVFKQAHIATCLISGAISGINHFSIHNRLVLVVIRDVSAEFSV